MTIKPVQNSSSSLFYGQTASETVEVASGQIDVNAGVVTVLNAQGVASFAVYPSGLLITLAQEQPLGRQTYLQPCRVTSPVLIVNEINETPANVGVSFVDPAGAPVDPTLLRWRLSFSIRQPV